MYTDDGCSSSRDVAYMWIWFISSEIAETRDMRDHSVQLDKCSRVDDMGHSGIVWVSESNSLKPADGQE